jgi:heptose I phosphotransferase
MVEAVHVGAPLDAHWAGVDPFDWLETAEGEVFRDLPDRRTFRFRIGDAGFFAKLHRGVGWREIGKNLVSGRLPVLDARTERDAIAALTAAGVPTMETVAWGVRGANPARRRSFIVTREIPTQRTLDDVARGWARDGDDVAARRATVRRVGDLVRRMHAAGVNHRDLYLVHFLVPGAPDAPDGLRLIDLHRAQRRRVVPRRWRVKDLGSLDFSARVGPLSRTDRLRFVAAYRGRPAGEALRAEPGLWRAVRRRGDALWAEGVARGIVP